jgi:hypothetical protein
LQPTHYPAAAALLLLIRCPILHLLYLLLLLTIVTMCCQCLLLPLVRPPTQLLVSC